MGFQEVQWGKKIHLQREETPELQVQSLGQGDALEEEVVAPSRILAWRIPQTGAWRARVHGVARVRPDLSAEHTHRQTTDVNSVYRERARVVFTKHGVCSVQLGAATLQLKSRRQRP